MSGPARKVKRVGLRATWSLMRPFVARYRRQLVLGSAASILVVLVRITLPWPFVHWMTPWLEAPTESIRPAALAGGAFLVLYATLGLFDSWARVNFARFSVNALGDVRREVLATGTKRSLQKRPGELVSRLVGDVTRVREGVKGFLVHVATNGLVFLGTSAVLLVLDYRLGAIMLAAFVATMGVTLRSGRRVFRRARKLRRREGRLASRIQRWWSGKLPDGRATALAKAKKRYKASLTRIQGRATFVTHVVLALATLACLGVVFASESPRAGETFVVLAYAVNLHHPVVRLCRQGTRSGKVLASLMRIERAIERKPTGDDPFLHPLGRELRLERARILGCEARGAPVILEEVDAVLPRGARVAVLGGLGSGKSTLLSVLAGRRAPSQGRVRWDDRDLDRIDPRELKARVRRLHGTMPGGRGVSSAEWEAITGSTDPGRTDLFLLDDPFAHVGGEESRLRLDRFLEVSSGATVVVAMTRPVALERFDRVYSLTDRRLTRRTQRP